MELCVCKYCKKIFKHKFKMRTCQDCKEKDDDLFNSIDEYLKIFPNSNALQISEALNIDVYDITRFIDEGRLVITKGVFERLED